ncbi:MAG: OsmC family peroxiredoxin [Alphaproteobacteria bacterium]|nr:OsmC family peroxiredoxin [Alphaproteobacteria bacterium]
MAEHIAEIIWRRDTESFAYEAYGRSHDWRFDNGLVVRAAAAPEFRGDPANVDPEEAFVASIASCHMLTFLAICSRKRIVIDAYEDRAVGAMSKNAAGKLFVSRIDLRPRISFAGSPPSRDSLSALHRQSHAECFIANSVMTEIIVHQDE